MGEQFESSDDPFAFWEESLFGQPSDEVSEAYQASIELDDITASIASDAEEELLPAIVDAAFDSYSLGDPLTAEQVQEFTTHQNAIAWLGDVITLPRILYTFSNQESFGNPGNNITERLVDDQLNRYAKTFLELTEGIAATHALASLTETYATSTLMHTEQAWHSKTSPNPSISVAQFMISATGDNRIVISERNDLARERRAFRHDRDDGSIHIIDGDAAVRHVISQKDDGIDVRVEVARSLDAEDPDYYGMLSESLEVHRQLMLQVAESMGFSCNNIVGEVSGTVDTKFLQKITNVMGTPAADMLISKDLRDAMGVSADFILRQIAPQNSDEPGLIERTMKTKAFFTMLQRQYS